MDRNAALNLYFGETILVMIILFKKILLGSLALLASCATGQEEASTEEHPLPKETSINTRRKSMKNISSQQVLDFWFDKDILKKHYAKDPAFDETIRKKFLDTHTQAMNSKSTLWEASAESYLAQIIVLDQFSRNIFRDTPQAFASDAKALALAKEAIDLGLDAALPKDQRTYIYMPFMHAENIDDQERSVALFQALHHGNHLKYALSHRDIVKRFGRFPHRNKILGRASTPEELEFLSKPGSSF